MSGLKFRPAETNDVDLFFRWANDEEVRRNSYTASSISLADHTKWFTRKVADPKVSMLVFSDQSGKPVGQVRIEQSADEHVIGISIDALERGKGYSVEMLTVASKSYCAKHAGVSIAAYIKKENRASIKAFERAGYVHAGEKIMHGCPSVKLVFRGC